MYYIYNIMLETLAKKHSKWLNMAFKLCQDHEQSKDVVQEMYIKMYDINNSNKALEIRDVYVWVVIRNIIISNYNEKQKHKMIPLDCLFNVEDSSSNFDYGLDDKELLFLNRAKEFRYLSRGLLELNYEKGLRQIETETGINYGYVFRTLEKVRKLILREDYEKLYKNKRLKHQK